MSQPGDTDDAVRNGAELERAGRWADAVRHYEASRLRLPADDRIANGLRRSKFHLEIARRYADGSFTTQLLAQNHAQAFVAFERVQTHVRAHYLEPLNATGLTAHGTESLYLALVDADFTNRNLRSNDQVRIAALRRSLQELFWNRRIADGSEAARLIEEVGRLCQREVGLGMTPVVWEYTCGSMHALDDYSGFLTPDMLRDFDGRIEGKLVGIGVELIAEHGQGARLLDVFESSPAERAGLQRGDKIIAVEGRDCREMPMEKITPLLLGTNGSLVNLNVASASGRVRNVRLTRSAFTIPSIVGVTMLDDERGIGYLRMTGFQRNTPAELDAALADLSGQGLRKLIWDLRGNAGGLLPTAIAVADRFLTESTIVSMKGRGPGQNISYTAQSEPTDVAAELIILVDADSASASEIVAAAVRDLGRGRLVGRKTFGKWCLQTVFPFADGTGLRLTTATFYSPLGLSYGGIGLAPDVVVPLSRDRDFVPSTAAGLFSDPDVQAAMKLFGGQTEAELLVTGFHPDQTPPATVVTSFAAEPVGSSIPRDPETDSDRRFAAQDGVGAEQKALDRDEAGATLIAPHLQAADWPFIARNRRGEYR